MNRHNSKSGLFLMEMIIVILFFSICAGICINVFASARIMAERSNDLNNAAVRGISAAECFKSTCGDTEAALDILKASGESDLKDVSFKDGGSMEQSLAASMDISSGDSVAVAVYDDMTLYMHSAGDCVADISVRSDKSYYTKLFDESGTAEIFEMSVRAGEAR